MVETPQQEPRQTWARIHTANADAASKEVDPDLLRLGEALTGENTKLLDWVFVKNRQLHGGFALELQIEAMRRKHRLPGAGK